MAVRREWAPLMSVLCALSLPGALYAERPTRPQPPDFDQVEELYPSVWVIPLEVMEFVASRSQRGYRGARFLWEPDQRGHQGWKVISIRRYSLVLRAGLRNGDVILRVNGQPLGPALDGATVLRWMQEQGGVTVDILRRDEIRQHRYEVL